MAPENTADTSPAPQPQGDGWHIAMRMPTGAKVKKTPAYSIALVREDGAGAFVMDGEPCAIATQG